MDNVLKNIKEKDLDMYANLREMKNIIRHRFDEKRDN